jgi:hypothetical protein
MESPLIQFSVNIEGYLTTGRYNKIQECMGNLPDPIFSHLMKYLLDSIRSDIENCIEVSYHWISLTDFCKISGMNGSMDEIKEYIRKVHVGLKSCVFL